MNTNNNSYTLIYAIVMVIIVALMLAFVSGALKSRQDANVELDKKKQILSSLNIDTKGQDAAKVYDRYIIGALVLDINGNIRSESKDDAFALDMTKEMQADPNNRQLPVFIANVDGQTKYIFSLQGAGLWGPIWGYISLNDDKNTVYGTYYSHASETPGLGANITSDEFQNQFIGKHILNGVGEFVSIAVLKAGKRAEGKDHVDALSGGTITSQGVEKMLKNSIGQYEKFLHQPTNGGNK
ncbi:MAG: NADH:ubiquinone reductase (Na(+)-transporting) subunit C [Prevotellaceae bacterium]|jgi:Na+-transporting NADH:ubiquinone oxidoreductase subunit C|nr:NADH:ubiquinone reductase (Na(+)-transporting) subunit C [Prevotellaceae bacterium]